MSLNAVENYVQGILDGMPSTLFPNAQAWVLPPPVVYLTTPQLFVWGGTFDEERHTLPRPLGFKRTMYQLTVKAQASTTNSTNPTDTPGPLAFPVLLDAVLALLRGLIIPVNITDPTTGATSVIQTIGERFRVQHPEPVASADQRMLLHSATISVFITEEFTG